MTQEPLDYDALRSEWPAFFGLLANDRGIRLRLNLPDTLVLRHGQPMAWFATNKEGYAVQRPALRTTFDDVRQHFLSCSMDSNGCYSQYVAIMRLEDGSPKLLTRPAFEALCDRLAAQLGDGQLGARDQTPCVLQAYVAPFLDLRFVTSYTNDGANISCHTFQRRFGRRYLRYRDPAQHVPQPGSLHGSQELQPDELATGPAAVAAAQRPVADAPDVPVGAAGKQGCVGSGGACAPDDGVDADVALDDGALADSERSLSKTLGPVDPSLKMLMRKAAHGLVQYVQKVHLLTLRGLVCEFARDSEGHLWFLGPLRTDWASLMPGRGGEPWANANLTQQARDEESWPCSLQDELDQHPQQESTSAKPQAAACSAGRLGGTGSGVVHASGSSSLPSAAQRYTTCGPLGMEVADHLLPAPAMPQQAQQRGSQSVAARHACSTAALPPVAAATKSPGSLALCGSSPQAKPSGSPTAQLPSPQQQLALKAATSRSPVQSRARERSPGAQQPTALPQAAVSRGSGYMDGSYRVAGVGPCLPPRGAASLTSHLTKSWWSLKDELAGKTDLAEALAYKAQALEHDKHVITGAFEQVLSGMQGDLRDVKGRLEALRQDRDRLACQLAEAEQKLLGAESERDHLRSRLDAERGTALTSLGQFQKHQEDAGVRAARAEAELRSVQEQLTEEQAACGALKKQMVFYQHAMSSAGLGGSLPGSEFGDGGQDRQQGAMLAPRGQERPEVKYVETLQAVDELLMREADPSGERYSLSKVLHTCQGDLHAIFLHYCLLDAGFARHWPPQMMLPGWLALLKDIGSTNLVPGTRTRSDNTMHVQEATDVFRRYCLRQAIMKGTLPLHMSSFRDPAVAAGPGDLPLRPPSSQSAVSGGPPSRPFSATTSAQLAGATMSYQSFCAALVHVAAKLARSSPEMLEDCPFLSEQTRAFVESIVPKAQQVAAIAQTTKKGMAAAAGPKQAVPAGGMGAKEAAAKEAAAKLPKLKKAKARVTAATVAAVAEMSAIAEASGEGSGAGSSNGKVART